MHDVKLIYDFCKSYVTVTNKADYECVQDTYGNRIESFLILDDLAICFCFNANNELLNCWYCN